MLYAILSDVHGNLHALRVVLEDLQRHAPDRIICLGDLVGYGAFPNDVTLLIREMADVVLMGNHDHAALGMTDISFFNRYAHQAALWTRLALTPENRAWLKELPYDHLERGLYFVHASPVHPEKWYYVFSDPEAEIAMAASTTATAFIGHTHVPRDHHTRRGRLINVGSVGQPRDGDPRAAYTLYDAGTGERRLVRLEYDTAAAGEAIRSAGLPHFLAERLTLGR